MALILTILRHMSSGSRDVPPRLSRRKYYLSWCHSEKYRLVNYMDHMVDLLRALVHYFLMLLDGLKTKVKFVEILMVTAW